MAPEVIRKELCSEKVDVWWVDRPVTFWFISKQFDSTWMRSICSKLPKWQSARQGNCLAVFACLADLLSICCWQVVRRSPVGVVDRWNALQGCQSSGHHLRCRHQFVTSAAATYCSGRIPAVDADVLGSEATESAVVLLHPAASEHRVGRTSQQGSGNVQPRAGQLEEGSPPADESHQFDHVQLRCSWPRPRRSEQINFVER